MSAGRGAARSTAVNLTMLENNALLGGLNVSDGHPRMPLTDSQRAIIDDLPALFGQAEKSLFGDIEREAHRAFLGGIGQAHAPFGTGRLASCYSSSVAMDITARVLAQRTRQVALIHPTFDNIPDILSGRGLVLLPLSERELAAGEPSLSGEVGAVFVTTPNNPTGWVLPEASLRRLAAFCARSGRVLALDTCFRAQDLRSQYDSYQVLDESGAEWVTIEDTGKLWPTQELKAGFLAWGARTRLPLNEAFSDVLLSVSPVVLLMITRFAGDAAAGGYAALHSLIRGNRAALADVLAGTPVRLADPGSRISVARLSLPPQGPTAQQLYTMLRRENVHTLPCGPFYWARRPEGDHQLRVALARPASDVTRAAQAIAKALGQGAVGHGTGW